MTDAINILQLFSVVPHTRLKRWYDRVLRF